MRKLLVILLLAATPGLARADLMLDVWGDQVALEYDTDVWERRTVERMARHLETVVRDLPLLSDEEQVAKRVWCLQEGRHSGQARSERWVGALAGRGCAVELECERCDGERLPISDSFPRLVGQGLGPLKVGRVR